MADIQAAQERTLVSPFRTILLGMVGAIACVALAWFEFYVLQAFGFDLSALWFVPLAALNLSLMAFIAFRSDRFKPRWLAAGATAGLMFVTGVVLLLQSALLTTFNELRSSLPAPPGIDVAGRDAPTPIPSQSPTNVPTAPMSTAPPSMPGAGGPAPLTKEAAAPRDSQVATIDGTSEPLPQITPRAAPAREPPLPPSRPSSPGLGEPPPVAEAPRKETLRPRDGKVTTIDGTSEPLPQLGPRAAPVREPPPPSSAPMTHAPPPVASAPPLPPGPLIPSARLPQVDSRVGSAAGTITVPINPNGNVASAAPPPGGRLGDATAISKMAKAGANIDPRLEIERAEAARRESGRPRGPPDGPVTASRSRPGPITDSGQVIEPGGPSPAGRQDPPPEQTAPVTAPATQPASEPVNTSAYWNSWFVDGTGPAANILIANNTYTYTLDVAAFDYTLLRRATQSSGAKVDPAFAGLIADSKTPEVLLTIKPLVPEGSGLRLADNQHFYRMKVDLEKIRHPNANAAGKYADGSISIAELSKQASAGSIQITLTAESQGCATIAFAIFRGLQPLDHLVQRVSVGETNTSAPVCDSANPAQADALSGGLDSLREVSLGMEGSGADVTAAAALHIFDFDVYSMAVFVDGRPGKNQTVYGWQTASSVVDFLKTDSFQHLILKARKDSADKKPGSYIPAAKELSKVLFSTKPGNATENYAKNARAAFRAVVAESKGAPVVVVRVASDAASGQNRSIYVPLGILGAKGTDPVLEKPIIVVQPMAIERYPSRDKCIGDWMFAVPDGLENVPGAVMPPGFFPAKIPGTRISEIEKLREYLAAATGSAVPLLASAPAAVGFVVLAHQDEGVMWFGESTNHIIPQDIEKKFPSGSVGIFAACSAASAKGRNAALLQRLNEQGIDTLIASPFTIDAGYGVVFASTFAEIMGEFTSDKPPLTILELFDKTVARTAQKFKDRADADYSELGLEYVLLGNPAIKLCASP